MILLETGSKIFERLVEQQNGGGVQQGGGERHLFPHAGRVVRDEVIVGRSQTEHVEELLSAAHNIDALKLAQEPHVHQQLEACESLEESQIVREHTDDLLHPIRVRPDVDSRDAHGAGVGPQETDDHPKRRRFPAPLGPTTPNQLPGGTVRSRPSTAVFAPNVLTRPRTWTAASTRSSVRPRGAERGRPSLVWVKEGPVGLVA